MCPFINRYSISRYGFYKIIIIILIKQDKGVSSSASLSTRSGFLYGPGVLFWSRYWWEVFLLQLLRSYDCLWQNLKTNLFILTLSIDILWVFPTICPPVCHPFLGERESSISICRIGYANHYHVALYGLRAIFLFNFPETVLYLCMNPKHIRKSSLKQVKSSGTLYLCPDKPAGWNVDDWPWVDQSQNFSAFAALPLPT